jgi:hypothetical protein
MCCLFVLFYALFVCKCVLPPPVVNPTAVKYIISYKDARNAMLPPRIELGDTIRGQSRLCYVMLDSELTNVLIIQNSK